MKRSLLCLVAGTVCSAACAAGPRTPLPLPGEWKFSGIFFDSLKYPVDKLPAGYEKSRFDDSGWQSCTLPGNWREESEEARTGKYMTGVYRRSVTIPAPPARGRVLLHFDGSSYDTHVWINGVKAGFHRGAFASFDMDITEQVRFNEPNLIVIRCDYTNDAGRRAVLLDHPFPGDRAGLWGDVSLELVPEVYIRQALIDSDPASGTIKIRYRMCNRSDRQVSATISARVADAADGKENAAGEIGPFQLAPGDSIVSGVLKLDRPRLWSQQDPALYTLTSTLNGGADLRIERFGFSKFETAGTKFHFNGTPIFLAARHLTGVDVPGVGVRRWGGFRMPWEEQKALLKQNFLAQKEDNVNMLRAHSGEPGPKFVYDAADEAGVLIYQEWSNYGVGKNLQPEYLEDFAAEMTEWLYMVYNNPSVVMISLANESPGFEEQTRCYEMLKPIFGDRYVICSSSGFLPLISGEIDLVPKTDLVDIHTYEGMCFRSMSAQGKASWQAMLRNTGNMYERCRRSWEAKGMKFELPFVAMEIPAGHWAAAEIGPAREYLDQSGNLTPEAYIRARDLSERQGPLPLGAWDLKNASLLDKFSGPEVNTEILNKINKRSIESIRRNPLISGVCVGIDRSNCTIQPQVYQPLLVCMEEQNFNWINGMERKFTLTVINDSPEAHPQSILRLSLHNSDGKVRPVDELPETPALDFREVKLKTDLAAGEREQLAISWKLRNDLPSGDYRLDLELLHDGKILSRNYSLIHARNPADWKPIPTDRSVGLLRTPDAAGVEKVRQVLRRFGVAFTEIPLGENLNDLKSALEKCALVIVPPFELGKPGPMTAAGAMLRRWVEEGGHLLSLETFGAGRLPWVQEWEFGSEGPTWFADIAPAPGHPICANLKQHHFDSWNGDDGHIADVMILPINVNMLAAAVCVMTDQLGAPAAEALLGKGRVMVSQFHALDRFQEDSIATQYLYNLLDYFLTQPVSKLVKPLTAGKKYSFDLDYGKCFYVDLRPYANRGFTDTAPGDRSGWTDQGENDLRHIPQGRMDEDKRVWDIAYNEALRDKQLFRGVPFDVIDQKSNSGKSCIVLRGELRREFPAEVTGIRVGRRATRLYFLHTAVFGTTPKTAEYVIHYADGTTETVPLRGRFEIADWWAPRHLDNALLAWSGVNPASKQNVGVYAFEYRNPHPDKEITTIDFRSEGNAVPVLLAITGTTE